MDQKIYEKTWGGEIFGPYGSLARVREEYRASHSGHEMRNKRVELVSQLYTAEKQCLIRWREQRWRIDLAFRAFWYGWEAFRLAHSLYLQSFTELNHKQLDVLGGVFLRQGVIEDAHECYEGAYALICGVRLPGQKMAPQKHEPHEVALVLCGLAICRLELCRQLDTIEYLFQEAREIALEPECDLNQSVRILRTVGEYEVSKGYRARAYDSLERALKCAQAANLPDQVLQCEQALRNARAKLDCIGPKHGTCDRCL